MLMPSTSIQLTTAVAIIHQSQFLARSIPYAICLSVVREPRCLFGCGMIGFRVALRVMQERTLRFARTCRGQTNSRVRTAVRFYCFLLLHVWPAVAPGTWYLVNWWSTSGKPRKNCPYTHDRSPNHRLTT